MGKKGTMMIDSATANVFDTVEFFERLKKSMMVYPIVISGTARRGDSLARMRPVVVESDRYPEGQELPGRKYKVASLYKAVQRCVSHKDHYTVRFQRGVIIIEARDCNREYEFRINRMTRNGRGEIEQRINNGEHFIPDGGWLAEIKRKQVFPL